MCCLHQACLQAFRAAVVLLQDAMCLDAGGKVMNVLFAAIIGGFSLGQAAPNFQYFTKGKIGGARIFAVIDRQPEISTHKLPPPSPTPKEPYLCF